MNDNQFMGLWIRFEGGGLTNSARQSIRRAPDSMVEDRRTTTLNGNPKGRTTSKMGFPLPAVIYPTEKIYLVKRSSVFFPGFLH